MANSAILAHRTLMNIITDMTGITGGRRTFEDTIDMATTACSADMRAHQFEGRCVVIERGWLPSAGGVTGLTELTHRTPVCVIADMASVAVGRRALEDTVGMTACTGSTDMRARQLEGRCIVIKRGWLPGSGGMASLAILAQGTLMSILAGMAGITVGRSTLVDTVNMATGTGGTDVCTR